MNNNPFDDKINKAVAEAARKVMEQSIAEGGPFSYGKSPRKGSVAANAEQKRKEQDRKTPPIEPKDQRVGNAKITKGVAEGLSEMDNRTPSGDRREQRANSPEAKAKQDKEQQNRLKDTSPEMRKKLRLPEPKEGVAEAKEKEQEDRPDVPFAGPYRKTGSVKKDKFGNVIKPENMASHLAKMGMAGVRKEEAEQIDELNRNTLRDYVAKAYADKKRRKALSRFDTETFDEYLKGAKKFDNRNTGITRAYARLNKEEAEQIAEAFVIHKGKHEPGMKSSLGGQTLHGVTVKDVYKDKKEAQAHADKINAGRGYKPEDHKNPLYGGVLYQVSPAKSMKEEVEQIDEISNRTKHRYMGSAVADLTSRSLDHGYMAGRKKYRASLLAKYQGRKIKNRQMGIARVADTLVKKEEVEQIDELSKKTLISYLGKASKSSETNKNAALKLLQKGGDPNNMVKASKKLNKAVKRRFGVDSAVDKLAGGAKVMAKEEADQIDELNKERGSILNRYITKATDDFGPRKGREAGVRLALKKKWGDKSYGFDEPKVKAVQREEAQQTEEGYRPHHTNPKPGWALDPATKAKFAEIERKRATKAKYVGKSIPKSDKMEEEVKHYTHQVTLYSKFKKEETSHIAERLTGKQHKIDANKNGKVDAHDFKLLRSKTKKPMSESYLIEDTTPALSAAMKAIIADSFHMYFKAHSFHWNVEGANFPQYHKFFGDVYEQLFETIDPIAEEIRALGDYAPRSLTELKGSTSIDDSSVQTPAEMFASLLGDNNKIIAGLTNGYSVAEASGEIGLSNFLQDKIDAHKKLGWMIKSTSKGA